MIPEDMNQGFMAYITCVILIQDLEANFMSLSKYKPTPKGGGERVEKIVSSTRKREPSDRLVKIISEVGQPEAPEAPKKDDQAAKDAGI